NERAEAAWRITKIRFQQAIELQQRLIVKDDTVERAQIDGARIDARSDRVRREAIIVLATRKTLLLGRRDYVAVVDQGRRAIMKVGGDTEYLHAALSRTTYK